MNNKITTIPTLTHNHSQKPSPENFSKLLKQELMLDNITPEQMKSIHEKCDNLLLKMESTLNFEKRMQVQSNPQSWYKKGKFF
jgi:hypothetical protein